MNKETESLFDDDYKETLRVARVKSGMSYREIANEMGMSSQGVYNIFTGDGAYYKVSKLCAVLGIEFDTILK